MAGNNHPWVGASLAWTVFGMVPDQRRTVGVGLYVQEEQRFFGLDGQLFQKRLIAILRDAIYPYEPGIFCIQHGQLTVVLLNGGMT